MNKRGQIYILAAILFGFTIFTLSSRINYAVERDIEDNFKELSDNYAIESSKYINEVLEKKDGEKVAGAISEFTINFEKFAINQNPNFGLIFLFPYEGRLYIENYLDKTIRFSPSGKKIRGAGGVTTVNIPVGEAISDFEIEGKVTFANYEPIKKDSKTDIPFIGMVPVLINNTLYNFEVNKDVPELVIFSKVDKEGQRKVFMNNKFVEGEIIE